MACSRRHKKEELKADQGLFLHSKTYILIKPHSLFFIRMMINIGLVGCGVISVAHLNAYEIIPEATVVAVCDIDETLASKRAKEYGIRSYYTDFHEMLRSEEIDVVDVCVPTQYHAQIAVSALENGKHVICEKPIAANLEEADRMIEAARKSNRLLLIGQSNRFLPMIICMKRLIDAGEVGDLMVVRVAHRFDNPYEKWLSNPHHPKYHWEKGGGPIIDSGVHGADLSNWLLKDQPSSVFARGITHPSVLPFFTSAHIYIEYGNGKYGVIQIDRATKNYPQYERYIEVIGSKKMLWGFDNYYRRTITPHAFLLEKLYATDILSEHSLTAHKPLIEYLPTYSEIYLELKEFINVIINKQPPPVTAEEARKALEVCIAAEISARSKKVVSLPLKS